MRRRYDVSWTQFMAEIFCLGTARNYINNCEESCFIEVSILARKLVYTLCTVDKI
jgi:hypothetical protein